MLVLLKIACFISFKAVFSLKHDVSFIRRIGGCQQRLKIIFYIGARGAADSYLPDNQISPDNFWPHTGQDCLKLQDCQSAI